MIDLGNPHENGSAKHGSSVVAYTEVASLSFLLTLIVRQGAFVSADRAARNKLSAITIKQ